jgi:hypothetical protein
LAAIMSEQTPNVTGIERHYRYKELKLITGLSDSSLRRLFDGEPGVVVLPHAICRKKRKYETILIPESVVQRVLRRLTRVA